MTKTLALILTSLLLSCGGSTTLEPVSARAERNQQLAAEAIIARVQSQCGDAGAIESLAETIYCSAGGNLKRAGQPTEDAGIPCPAQQ